MSRTHFYGTLCSSLMFGGLAGSSAAFAQGTLVPIAPLDSARPFPGAEVGGIAPLAAPPSGALPLPTGSISGFGSAMAAVTNGESDYVVVSAPSATGGGRVFVYRKPYSASSFDPVVELARPSGVTQFGKSVDITWGTIVVGANGADSLGRVISYSQERSTSGFPIDTKPFVRQTSAALFSYSDTTFGRSVTLARYNGAWYLYACSSSLCELFYLSTPSPTFPSSFTWNPVGPLQPGNSASYTPYGYFGVNEPDNQVSIVDRGLPSFGVQSWTFNAPTGYTFNGNIKSNTMELIRSPGQVAKHYALSDFGSQASKVVGVS